MEEDEFMLEVLPEHVLATMEVRDRAMNMLGSEGSGLEFLVDDLQKWKPGKRSQWHSSVAATRCARISPP